jgi:glycerophosphoryl diester phosphodiesterase
VTEWFPGKNTDALAADLADAPGLKTAFRRFPRVADMPSPVLVAHRSAGMLSPENTREAGRIAAALGPDIVPDVGDFRSTADGGVVAMHDLSMTRTTSLTGDLTDYTLAALRRSTFVDSSSWFGGGWPDLMIPTAEEIAADHLGDRVISIETKDQNATDRWVALLEQTGAGPSVLVTANTTEWAAEFVPSGAVAAPYQTAAQINAGNMAVYGASLLAAGISDVQVQHGSSLAKIAELQAQGIDVWVYNIFRHVEFDTYNGLGIRGFILDDPLYTSRQTVRYRRTAVSWTKSGTFGHGHLSATTAVDANRGFFTGTAGAYRWSQTLNGHVLIGELCPLVTPTNYTLTVPITFDTLPSDMTRWAGVVFGQATDDAYVDGGAASYRDAYSVILRANGDAQLYKVTDGVSAQIGSTSAMPDLTAGASVTLTVDVDPTTGITVTRSDGGAAITSADTAWRGPYVFLGNTVAASGSGRASFGAVTVA